MHVAIDRVSGGAREHLLFGEQVLDDGRFSIAVTANRELPEWATALLGAALADLHEGLIGIGRGTMRGNGTVEASDAQGRVSDSPPTRMSASQADAIVAFRNQDPHDLERTIVSEVTAS